MESILSKYVETCEHTERIMTQEIENAKDQFIQAWGSFSSNWGVNRTMAQIHALLLIAPEAKSAEEIMEELQISRGNVNMNVRELIDWGLVRKELRLGERKEYFIAEKDIWKVARQITIERRKRELDPMLTLLKDLEKIGSKAKTAEEKAFTSTISDIHKFSEQANAALDTFIRAEESWFFSTLLTAFK